MAETGCLRLKRRCVCRGSGKIFIEFGLFGLESCMLLKANSSTEAGDRVPCEIFRLPEELLESDAIRAKRDENAEARYVIIVADLSIRQNVRITCSNAECQEVLRTELKLDPNKVKWASRFNYRRYPDITAVIRNYDEGRSADQCSFGIHYALEVQGKTIIRMSCYSPIEYVEERGESLEVCMFSRTGTRIDVRSCVLGKSERDRANRGRPTTIEVVHTIEFPAIFDEFTVALSQEGRILPGFFTVVPEYYHKVLSKGKLLMINAQNDPAYHELFLKKRITPAEIELQRNYTPVISPSFSIIVPLFKTPLQYLDKMIASVLAQSYENWELILVNASPEDTALKERVEGYVCADTRIEQIELDGNRGISENTNAGIAKASGTFVSFFDHDDLLEPDILFEYMRAIEQDPEIDVLYCDEDKLMQDKYFVQPFFKPDFSPDLLRSNNYICHMLTIRKTLLDTLVQSTAAYDGAQDHNLTLQAIEHARKVGHVAKVLYHWRMSATSTASSTDTKPYASRAGIRAVQEHLDRVGIDATASLSRRPFTYKLTYSAPEEEPLVSIIIPSKDNIKYLDRCLKSIANKTTYSNYEVVIVENNSEEKATFDYYESITDQRVRVEVWPSEFNFSKIINYGASKALGEYYLLLNNDTELITPNWIQELLGRCSRSDVGIVGVKLYYPDGSIQHAGLCVAGGGRTGGVAGLLNRNLPQGEVGYFALSDSEQNLSAVTAACCMVSKEDFESVGGFTEEIPVAFNDVDFCLKLREQDKLVLYTPEVELMHHESVSRGDDKRPERKARFIEECAYMHARWANFFAAGDPYYNKNFSHEEPWMSQYQLKK